MSFPIEGGREGRPWSGEQTDGLSVACLGNGMPCRGSRRFGFADGIQNYRFSADVDSTADRCPEEAVDHPGGGNKNPFLSQGADDVVSHGEVDAGDVESGETSVADKGF